MAGLWVLSPCHRIERLTVLRFVLTQRQAKRLPQPHNCFVRCTRITKIDQLKTSKCLNTIKWTFVKRFHNNLENMNSGSKYSAVLSRFQKLTSRNSYLGVKTRRRNMTCRWKIFRIGKCRKEGGKGLRSPWCSIRKESTHENGQGQSLRRGNLRYSLHSAIEGPRSTDIQRRWVETWRPQLVEQNPARMVQQ
jgi:hypothetical protein